MARAVIFLVFSCFLMIKAATVKPTTFPSTTTSTVVPSTSKAVLTPLKQALNALHNAKTTSTSTSTTTTAVPTTTTPVTVSGPTTTTQPPKQVRQCKCEEFATCVKTAHDTFDACKESCAPELKYFGDNVEKFTTCFSDKHEPALMVQCIKNGVSDFCSSGNETVKFIPEPDYSGFVAPHEQNDDKAKRGVLMQKARSAFTHFRQFQSCVVTCLKGNAVSCFQKQKCGVVMPPKQEMKEVFANCNTIRPHIHNNARKACQCLVHKQGVKKLVGVCPVVGNAFTMRLML